MAKQDKSRFDPRFIALGAGIGMILGMTLGNAGYGLVLGAAAGVVVGRMRGRRGADETGSP